jgi:hypothetical protein
MARTALAVQSLNTKGGQAITWEDLPTDDGTSIALTPRNTVRLLVKAESGDEVTVTVVSKACSHGRTGDLTQTVTGPATESFGPYSDPTIWGDGSHLQVNYGSITGTPKIAAVQ